jgi:hypothetical protein
MVSAARRPIAMTQYWWVNHSQTVQQEVDGQYLWSPKTERNGSRSEFYSNMRRATPGDLVLSYSDRAVRFVGRVTEFAFSAPKPSEFGEIGAYWNTDGWLVPVFWVPLRPIVYPRSIIDVLGPLLPDRYSPLHPVTGHGNQKAYLAAISQAVFDVVLHGASYDASALSTGGSNSLNFQVVQDLLDDSLEHRIVEDNSLSATEKATIVLARRGQGKFRANVEAIERECRLTGITNPALLRASHIRPWRLCQSSAERLDGMNGLLLTPDADLLFDRGFMTFADSGEVLISPRVDRRDLRRLGLEQVAVEQFGFGEAHATWRTSTFVSGQQQYLAYHRSEIFIS